VSKNRETGEVRENAAQGHIPAKFNFARSPDGQAFGIELRLSRDYSLEAGDRVILLRSWSAPICIQDNYPVPSFAMAIEQFAEKTLA
jgi:hypothetical protein